MRYMMGSKYHLHNEQKTWEEAEAHCQGGGGHLASILTAEEDLEVMSLVGEKNVWIGGKGRKSHGHTHRSWTWTDNRTWGFTKWDDEQPNRGSNCVQIYDPKWITYDCDDTIGFVCQFSFKVITGSTNITLEYTKDELFSPFTVKYEYLVGSQDLLDSWNDKRMTGFRLNWFLQDSNGSRLTEVKPDSVDWRPEPAVPKYRQPEMAKMVQLASKARTNNMTTDQIILQTLKHKGNRLKIRTIEYKTMCSKGEINHDKVNVVFDGISLGLNEVNVTITDDDVKTGLMMFSAVVYCSETVALYQFLHSLLSAQSPRTIIQATVNTIQSDNIKQSQNRKRMKVFYRALDKVFHFHLGKILLAISSKLEIEAMMNKEWPYFDTHSKEIDQCLNGDSCQGVTNILHALGETKRG